MTVGRFLTLEGGEGVGKTTLLEGLRTHFSDSKITVIFTREPGGSPRAELLRTVLLSETNAPQQPMSVATEALIISAARSDHVDNTIMPALDRGDWVICDRFTDSTLAYQGGAVSAEYLNALNHIATKGLRPDLTILLDGDPAVLHARRVARGAASDRFEARELDFHKTVRDRFLEIARLHPDRVVVVNAIQPPEQVLLDVVQCMERLNSGRDSELEAHSKP